MRRWIRIPNKVLLTMLIVLLVGIGAGAFWGDHLLVSVAQRLNMAGKFKASTAAYAAIVNFYPDSKYTPQALYFVASRLKPVPPRILDYPGLAKKNFSLPANHVALMEHSASGPPQRGDQAEIDAQAEQKVSYLRRVLRERTYPDYFTASLLGRTLAVLGRYDEATQPLEQAMEGLKHGLQDQFIPLTLADSYRRLGKLEEAEATLREALEYPLMHRSHVLYALADLLESKGNLAEAQTIYAQLAGDAEVSPYFKPYMQQRADALEHLLGRVDNEDEIQPVVMGRATANGQGLPGIEIVITKDLGNHWTSNPEPLTTTITNSDGEFRIYRLSPGSYRLEVIAPVDLVSSHTVRLESPTFQVVSGKTAETGVQFERPARIVNITVHDEEPYPVVDVEWESDPRANGYRLQGLMFSNTVSFNFSIIDATLPPDQTRASFPIDEKFTRPITGYAVGKDGIDFTQMLGVRWPEVQVKLLVIPLDAKGTPLIGTRTSWRLPGSQPNLGTTFNPPRPALSEGDRLLFDRQYERAIAAYEQAIEKDPDDTHSLYVLWCLAERGTDMEHSYANADRAQELGDRLFELTGDERFK